MYAIKNDYSGWRLITSLSELTQDEASFSGEISQHVGLAKYNKKVELSAACKGAIEMGFYSSALGSLHRYDADKPQDQFNLIGAAMAGLDRAFTCTDAAGIKWKRPHTADQLKQVFADGSNHVSGNTDALYAKLAILNLAETIEAVSGVNW